MACKPWGCGVPNETDLGTDFESCVHIDSVDHTERWGTLMKTI
jgi:hypothetical protein